eukprot:CAMPEP_0197651244 /NCGR_PEP_ID=MMETSP1338-20131121/31609_1 /TAXON_ID=43686 ORGANISM="Pelagodinium beii, Strain RCC1491" /NCGR_SAMPLE_ID=MMETSP1338 /ASSEMBLY_ACC=CAM_ASM_000754 /LENGTH=274 /DNA_ID=CAMNT_0043225825 /DNA_START=129 /DNA_END=953 /DNA_ORIENTATION=+
MAAVKLSALALCLALAAADEVKSKSLMQKGAPLPVLKKLGGLSELGDGETLLLEEVDDELEIISSKMPAVDEQCMETARTASRGVLASALLTVLSMLPEILSWTTALIGMKILAALLCPGLFISSCKVVEEDEDAWIDELPDDPPVGGSYTEEKDDFSCTALHVACHNASAAEVSKLIALGADVNAREAWNETPLHMASRAGSREICFKLLEAKADVEAKNADGKTPLIVAAQARKESVCELFLDCEAKADMPDEELPPLLNILFLQRLLRGKD